MILHSDNKYKMFLQIIVLSGTLLQHLNLKEQILQCY